MIDKPNKFIEQYRMRGVSGSPNGAFQISGGKTISLAIVSSNGGGWDHVSVHVRLPNEKLRCPTWEEIDYVRKLFFKGDEWVMQLHVPTSKHINAHPHVLHLWRPQNEDIPIPPPEFV